MKKVTISGIVQGVGYRYFTYVTANKLEIFGTVRNLDNGDVEILINSNTETKKYEKFIEQLREGPKFAKVDKIYEENIKQSNEYKEFSII